LAISKAGEINGLDKLQYLSNIEGMENNKEEAIASSSEGAQ
jgi:hypothetical protein